MLALAASLHGTAGGSASVMIGRLTSQPARRLLPKGGVGFRIVLTIDIQSFL